MGLFVTVVFAKSAKLLRKIQMRVNRNEPRAISHPRIACGS